MVSELIRSLNYVISFSSGSGVGLIHSLATINIQYGIKPVKKKRIKNAENRTKKKNSTPIIDII